MQRHIKKEPSLYYSEARMENPDKKFSLSNTLPSIFSIQYGG